MTVLEKIVNNRLQLLEIEKQTYSIKDVRLEVEKCMESGYRPTAFYNKPEKDDIFLIAEIKKSSPSKGVIRKDFDVAHIANAYKKSAFVNGISVLTEPHFFMGSYEYIDRAKSVAEKPILMKDFIVDSYQIYRGYLAGASAALLIASILEDAQIEKFLKIAKELNMDILFEVHSSAEYKRALNFDIDLIGINNRDLKTFITDIKNTIKIIEKVGKFKDKAIISESGINAKEDIRLLAASGADGFLIGEKFMKSGNIEKSIASLFGD